MAVTEKQSRAARLPALTLEDSLPHSRLAERAILGAILLNNALLGLASELLRPADFYVRPYQLIFRAMCSLSERGSTLDPILVAEKMRREGTLEQAGGMAGLSELTDGLPHSDNIAAYVEVVRRHSLARRIVCELNRTLCATLEGSDEPETQIDRALESLTRLSEECARADTGDRRSLMNSFEEFMQTQFEDAEAIAFNARRGEVALVQSVTNAGKSILLRNTALSLAAGRPFSPLVDVREARRVLLINYEGSAGWYQRDLAVMVQDFTPEERDRVTENFFTTHAPEVRGVPLSLPTHLRYLESQVRRCGGVDVLFLDTAAAAFSLKNENDNREVTNDAMTPLANLGRRLNCLVVIAHHIGKARLEEGSAREGAYRGRGASAWGASSSSVFNLDADPGDRGRVTASCAKRKDGPPYQVVFEHDYDSRWYRATGETAARTPTSSELVLEAIEGSGLAEISTGEVERLLHGKLGRSTVNASLKRLLKEGKVSSPRHGRWALLEVCPTCLTPLEGRTSCTTCEVGPGGPGETLDNTEGAL
jgi:hypothetical protein